MGTIPYKKRNEKLTILAIGAHPDDCDIKFGGTAIKYLEAGHRVVYLSLTNGDAGHHEISGQELADRRRKEADEVAKLIGVEYMILNNHDGKLQADMKNRHELIGLIRKIQPDLIFTHRPNDYHADHRNTSMLVQDSAYLIAVPNLVKDVPALNYNPVIMYFADKFQKPYPFIADVLVDITDVNEKKMKALSMHECQVFEWLPWIERFEDKVPTDEKGKLEFVNKHWGDRYKTEDGKHIESFERCEFGGKLTNENFKDLFPFGINNFN